MDKHLTQQILLNCTIIVIGATILVLLIASSYRVGGHAVKIYQHPFTVSNTTRHIKNQLSETHLHLIQAEPNRLDPSAQTAPVNKQMTLQLSAESDFTVIKEYFLGEPEMVIQAEKDCIAFYEASRHYLSTLTEEDLATTRMLYQAAKNSLDAILAYAMNKALVFKSKLEDEIKIFIILLSVGLAYAFFVLYWFHRANLKRFSLAIRERDDASQWGTVILNATPDPTIIFDSHGKVVSANEQASIFYGYSSTEIKSLSVSNFIPSEFRERHTKNQIDYIKNPSARSMGDNSTFKSLKKNGDIVDVAVTLSHAEFSHNTYVIASIRDKTKEKEIQDYIRYQAHYDQLTGLPNRTMVKKLFSEMTRNCDDHNCRMAFAFIDLDNFKTINDTLGHDTGDEVLTSSAKRLKNALRDNDVIARLGGDEFIVLLANMKQESAIERVSKSILSEFDSPIEAGNKKFNINISIGLAVYPTDGKKFSDLCRKADAAMYHAKALGGGNYCRYFDTLSLEIIENFKIEEALANASFDKDFFLMYQPQFDVTNNEIVGAEVLVRWEEVNGEHYTPDQFIPVAEKSGYIIPLGKFIIKKAIEFSKAALKEKPELHISINISPRQLKNADAADYLIELIKANDLPSESIILEITEGILLDVSSETNDSLVKLATNNISFSMDDFGKGYSSLSYFQTHNFKYIKLDKCFINDIGVSKDSETIIKSSVAMAQTMGIKVVAEGVEKEEQLNFLKAIECNFFQGFLYSKPLLEADFFQLLTSHQTEHSRGTDRPNTP